MTTENTQNAEATVETTEVKKGFINRHLGKVKTAGKYAGYGLAAGLTAGGAYLLYKGLKTAGADGVAEAVGEVATAATEAVTEAAADAVAALR